MKEEYFLEQLQEELEIESVKLELSTNFEACDEWDSLSQLILIQFANKEFSVNLNSDDILELKTVKDFSVRVGLEY